MANEFLGNVEINPSALEVIASIAVTEVEGVSKLLGNIKDDTLEKFGKKVYSKGIRLDFEGNSLVIDVYCHIKYGYSIATIARTIQENVKNSIFNMTEIHTKSVNVNILGIDF